MFYSRQIEVRFEGRYFHWITNRALRRLEELGEIRTEVRELSFGGKIKLIWDRRYRYYKRSAAQLVQLVEEYSNSTIAEALGLHGERMVLEGFVRHQFVQLGQSINSFGGRQWPMTDKDLDFVLERDGVVYGVEVKNTLSYIDQRELLEKTDIAKFLGMNPVFVVRMMPANWIWELSKKGGFALILKYQLYPWGFGKLAQRVREELGLPVDSPKKIEDGTMGRFLNWHAKNV